MNILLTSQCNKRALTQTRRILDQFAERRGDRTWQTPITEAGLATLRKLLRQSARKNTAVACHWIRGRDHSELLWIVGNACRFNAEGAVPTNTTTHNVLRHGDENDWHTAQDIRLLAQLAALLHDLGKASIAFQERLRGKRRERNLYRHEWGSLRLFQAFVGTDTDEGWLKRLADSNALDEQPWIAEGRYQRDGLDAETPYPFRSLPPLAQAVAWLVVTHHRLPVIPVSRDDGSQDWMGKRSNTWKSAWLDAPLSQVSHDWNEIRQSAEREQIEPYWNLAGPLPVIEPTWRKKAARLAQSLLDLRQQRDDQWLHNSYVMHLARLSLMLADHHYSSLEDSPLRVKGDGNTKLYANTARDNTLKQPLDEHLLGVAHEAGLVAHALPGFERHLPRLANHRGLRKRSVDPRFTWQDKAADAATSLRETAREHGSFIVNMASTGCGKTLANARILYALSDPQQGMRVSYALGLRTLTMQTGRSYRKDLHLGEDELAVHVGGSANRNLFAYYQAEAEAHGSASTQSLIEEDSHVLYEGNTTNHPLLSRAMQDPAIRKLLSAPILVCTVDHLVPATEALRAGRQIAPMLRLMSADLVLDELDDYGLDDLPALTRLMHWAGMLGTRVILSSATLPPSLVTGMYLAYRTGRRMYRRNRGQDGGTTHPDIEVPCLWTDEFGVHVAMCGDGNTFHQQHQIFITKRAARLGKATPLRRGELLPLTLGARQPDQRHAEFATHIHGACLRLHDGHAETVPINGKRVSFGLVRMANIDPLFDVAQALFALGAPENTRIHLCVYHARFPLLQRSAIEHLLDTTFNRRGDGQAVYQLPDIRSALDAYPEQNHLFVALASPVCEVGRDWDADWAVAEPSSMRSLIQLAGRVQRHRGKPVEQPNILVFDTNLKHFRNHDNDEPCFVRPGYEKSGKDKRASPFKLSTHWLHELMAEDEYHTINALPRVHPRPTAQWQSTRNLADLEQARTASSMLPPPKEPRASTQAIETDQAYVSWMHPQATLTGVLPQQQPFRSNSMQTVTLAMLPDEDELSLQLHRIEEEKTSHGRQNLYIPVDASQRHDASLTFGPRISSWGKFDLMALLAEQAEHLDQPLDACARRMAIVEASANKQGWRYHPLLGFAKYAR